MFKVSCHFLLVNDNNYECVLVMDIIISYCISYISKKPCISTEFLNRITKLKLICKYSLTHTFILDVLTRGSFINFQT